MSTPKPMRIALRRRGGFRLQEASKALNGLPAVMVTRPGKWGNPFGVGCDGTPEQCVRLFRKRITDNIYSFPTVADIRRELRGKNLACWCGLDQPCHADVLLEIANNDNI